jgi:hypothetical protein
MLSLASCDQKKAKNVCLPPKALYTEITSGISLSVNASENATTNILTKRITRNSPTHSITDGERI